MVGAAWRSRRPPPWQKMHHDWHSCQAASPYHRRGIIPNKEIGMRHRTLMQGCATALALAAVGCGAPGEDKSGAPAAVGGAVAAAPTNTQKLIWSEELAPDHRVSFYELSSGAQAALEAGNNGTA